MGRTLLDKIWDAQDVYKRQVMGMEVEPKLRIACHHVAAKPFGGIGVEDAKRVGAHEALHGGVGQPVEYRVDVPGKDV